MEVFSADQGVLSQSLFRVALPEVQKYFNEEENVFPECGEAYNHNNGTPYIEHFIRQIKELQRFAVLYILRNPNFQHFKFTTEFGFRDVFLSPVLGTLSQNRSSGTMSLIPFRY